MSNVSSAVATFGCACCVILKRKALRSPFIAAMKKSIFVFSLNTGVLCLYCLGIMAYLELVELIPRFCGCHFPICQVGKLNQDITGGSLSCVVITDEILVCIQIIVYKMQRISARRRSSHDRSEEVSAAMCLKKHELVCRVDNKALAKVLMHLRELPIVVSSHFAHRLNMCRCTLSCLGGFIPIGCNSR